MNAEEKTRNKIVLAALSRYLAQGIKKTSMEDVASQAGVTRVTVYRYFGEKKQLVRAAFMHIVSALENVQETIAQGQNQNVEQYVDLIGAALAALPTGDLPARMEELGRLYPDVLSEFHQARLAAIGKIFDQLFATASEQGILRDGLHRAVVQAYFLEAVVKVMESPGLVALDLSSSAIFATVKTIFLHGILKEKPAPKLNPWQSFFRATLDLVQGRYRFPRHRIGEIIVVDGQKFTIFRQMIREPVAGESGRAEAVFRVRFRLAHISPELDKPLSILTIPIYVSLLQPDEPTGVPLLDVKRQIEAMLAASGVPWSSLRVGFHMGDVLGRYPALLRRGVLLFPLATQRTISFTAEQDVARVIMALQQRDLILNGALDVIEPVARTLAEVAELAGQISGRKVIASGNWPWLSLLRLALPLFRRFNPVMASKVHMLTYFDGHDYVGKSGQLAAVLPGFEVTAMEAYLRALLRK